MLAFARPSCGIAAAGCCQGQVLEDTSLGDFLNCDSCRPEARRSCRIFVPQGWRSLQVIHAGPTRYAETLISCECLPLVRDLWLMLMCSGHDDKKLSH